MANSGDINVLEQRASTGNRSAIRCLVQHLRTENRELKCQALLVLARIMEASEPINLAIINCGVMDPLLSIFQAASTETNHGHFQLLEGVTAALGFATYNRRDMIEKFFQRTGLVHKMVNLLLHGDKKVRANAFYVISRWVSIAGTDAHTREVLRLGVIRKLPLFLELNNEQLIRQASLRFLSNVVADSRYGVNEVIISGLVDFILFELKQGSTLNKKECVWIIANMVHAGSVDHRRHLIEAKVIPLLQNLLSGEFRGDAEISGIIKETLDMFGA